jgi:hypothetical protein
MFDLQTHEALSTALNEPVPQTNKTVVILLTDPQDWPLFD